MLSKISIPEVIESQGFESSLITTFNANLPFYEEMLLRRLRANGCRHNVVLMDDDQCSASWESDITRPKQAGFEYSLLPIKAAGAFHPKLAIFAGPKKVALFVGSHNLTIAGLGFNREISNLIEIGAKKHEYGTLLAGAWASVTSWLASAGSYCPPELVASAFRLENYLRPFFSEAKTTSTARFMSQSAQAASLFMQLRQSVNFAVRRVLVSGAFFDQKLGFLKALREWLPTAEIVVGIDPATVVLPALNEALKVRFVDARAAWPGEEDKYLHAKAFFLEGADRSVFLSGSANPSSAGWGTIPKGANTEAMILLEDVVAQDALSATGLDRLFDFAPIPLPELEKVVERGSAQTKTEDHASLSLLLGLVDYDAKNISVKLPSPQPVLQVQPFDELGVEMDVSPIERANHEVLTISFPSNLEAVRSLVLSGQNGPFARVLVHHTSVIDAHSRSGRHQAIRAALGELGATETDVAFLIQQVQHVIFAAEAADHVGYKVGATAERPSTEASRPNSLAADDSEFGRQRKKQRLIRSGDLGYLIDTLIRFLHTPRVTASNHTPEPISLDQEGAGMEDSVPEPILDDPAVAKAILHKSRSLIRKMIEREKQAATEESYAPTMLVQLTAVIAILKELRHLERQGRWSSSGLELVDSRALESLFQTSMLYLFSSKHRLWALVEKRSDEQFEELVTLSLLLTWLAWEVGHTFTPSIPHAWCSEKQDRDWLLAGNGYLGKLLPRIGVENNWKLLETSIQRTIRPIPQWKIDADAWLAINVPCGEALLDEFTNADKAFSKRFSVGGFAYVPSITDPWSVVLDVEDDKVALWDFQLKEDGVLQPRRFLQSVVIPAKAINGAPPAYASGL